MKELSEKRFERVLLYSINSSNGRPSLSFLLHRPLGRVEVGLEEGLDLVRHLPLGEVEGGVFHDAVVQLTRLVTLLEELGPVE